MMHNDSEVPSDNTSLKSFQIRRPNRKHDTAEAIGISIKYLDLKNYATLRKPLLSNVISLASQSINIKQHCYLENNHSIICKPNIAMRGKKAIVKVNFISNVPMHSAFENDSEQ
ncbi:hypothetical protein JTB14_006610 [Gonioctena quinquepunctata]|nr:hypothetical protein JTB14_006610 [Gonioctena quinquepunctata]